MLNEIDIQCADYYEFYLLNPVTFVQQLEEIDNILYKWIYFNKNVTINLNIQMSKNAAHLLNRETT